MFPLAAKRRPLSLVLDPLRLVTKAFDVFFLTPGVHFYLE